MACCPCGDPTIALFGIAEPFDSLSHLIGAVVFGWMGVSLLRRRAGAGIVDPAAAIYLSVFVVSATLLLTMSGVYHLLPFESAARPVLRRLDHAAIFVLIAGTFTAVHGVMFRGIWRWGVIVFVWVFAITGITLKTVFFAAVPESLGLALYIGFGWVGVLTGGLLWRRRGFEFVRPLAFGGIAYTVGAMLEFSRQPVLVPGVIGAHELFHVAALVGLGFHFQFVARAIGSRAAGPVRIGG